MKLKKMILMMLGTSMILTVGCSTKTQATASGKGAVGSVEKVSKKEELNNTSQFPVVNEPITIKVMANMREGMPEYGEIAMWKKYEEMTGVKVEWESVGAQSLKEKVKLAFASNEMPDAFLKCKISNADMLKFGSQGMLLDLAPYLEEYAPNVYKYINEHEDVKKGITFPNGAIYGLPAGVETPAVRVAKKVFINKNWLDKLGLPMPTTTEEFYDVLKAFKEQDPNGNGKADEVPLTSEGLGIIYEAFVGSFGLCNRGIADDFIDYDEEKDGIRVVPTQPEYKEYMAYLNRLYTDGLLDYEIFTMDASQFIAKGSQDMIGCFIGPNAGTLPQNIADQFVGLEVALEGPNGDQMYSPLRTYMHSPGAFVISAKNPHPEATLRWIDYFYSNEGMLMYHYGIENETYEKQADGTYDFVPSIYAEIGGNNSFDSVLYKYVTYAGGNNPTIIKEPFFCGAEMQPVPYEASMNMMPFVPKEVWPQFTFTIEENDRLSIVKTDINKYVSQMRTEFISGKTSLDNWDNYLKQIDALGLEECIQIYTQAYERYIK